MTVGIITSSNNVMKPEIIRVKECLDKNGLMGNLYLADRFPLSSSYQIKWFKGSDVLVLYRDAEVSNLMEENTFLIWLPFDFEQIFTPRNKPNKDEWKELYDQYEPYLIANYQVKSFWISLLRMLSSECHVVNSIDSIISHNYKPHLYYELMKAGVKVPEFTVGNNEEYLKEITREFGTVVYKPLTGGREALIVNELFLENNKSALRFEPVLFQKKIPGTQYRTYVLGSDIIGSAIVSPISSDHIDHRAGNVRLKSVDLPPIAETQILKASRKLGFEFCGIDLVESEETGEFYVLDCNGIPDFAFVEDKTDIPVTQRLCDYLARKV